jgi:hypothetical protein
MQWVRRALSVLRFHAVPEARGPSAQERMRELLHRIRTAERQIQEATSLEELDIGRATLIAAHAEMQQLIRIAKRERGIALRPIAETEELHRNLRDFLNQRSEAYRRRFGARWLS